MAGEVNIDPRTPCIIGVARQTWHPDEVGPEGAPEPLDMWEQVARAAATDAGRPDAITAIDGLNLVYCQTWQYDDAVQRLSDRLGADPKQRCYSGIGGTMGQQLVNATATRTRSSRTTSGRSRGSRHRIRVRWRTRSSRPG